MNIIKEIRAPYIPNASRQAVVEAKIELARMQGQCPAEQMASAARHSVDICGTATYWSRGVSKGTPFFVQHSPSPSSGIKRVHILLDDAVAVYDRRDQKSWERRALLLLTDAEAILASLPKKALSSEVSSALATQAQLAVITKNLNVNVASLPPLSAAAVSRLIDRLTCERDIAELAVDALEWVQVPVPMMAE
jgi:hypothetical protein